MQSIDTQSFEQPDETRPMAGKGMADVVSVIGRPIATCVFPDFGREL